MVASRAQVIDLQVSHFSPYDPPYNLLRDAVALQAHTQPGRRTECARYNPRPAKAIRKQHAAAEYLSLIHI